MLLNLMAALSLASIGAVAGISSNARYVIGRKDAHVAGFNSSNMAIVVNDHAPLTDVVLFDGVLHFYVNQNNAWLLPSGAVYRLFASEFGFKVAFDLNGFGSQSYLDVYSYYIDAHPCVIGTGDASFFVYGTNAAQLSLVLANADNSWVSDVDWDNARLTVLKSTYSWADYEADHQIVSGIASGLTSVQHYATSLVSGFDALALDNGALTNSMAFAFTLLGIGTAVGICKLMFNWITGRHGM